MNFVNQMIWIDYAIIGLVGIYLIIGLARGGSKEILSLLSWFLSLGVSWGFALEFSGFLQTLIAHPAARLAASFASLVIITRVFTSFIFFLMKEGSKTNRNSFADHFSGMLVGALRGLVIAGTMILLGGLTPLPKDSWWLESRLIPPFQSSAIWIRDNIPSGMAGYVNFR